LFTLLVDIENWLFRMVVCLCWWTVESEFNVWL
jgi:hypothetical protein